MSLNEGMSDGTYDEALDRLHRYGPEFDGFLSNHGPMVVEAMWRNGAEAAIHRWTDTYATRLDDSPRATGQIDEWREALGARERAGEWIAYFRRAVADEPWSDVVATWWPRLLPGIAGGATHGVIRLGHALQSVREAETAPRVDEVAHALAYWATCWLPVPVIQPAGTRPPGAVLDDVPPVADRSGGIRARLAQLPQTAGYVATAGSVAPVDDARLGLEQIVDDAVAAYARFAPGNATMLVHAATAPNAVRMALPSLPVKVRADSVAAAWSATTAVIAAYRPRVPIAPRAGLSADDVFAAAVAHGSEHVIKLTDTALASWHRTRDAAAISAVAAAIEFDA